MSKYKLYDELVFIGNENRHGYYTKNKRYMITHDHGNGQYQLTDNENGNNWWTKETLDESFELFISSPIREVKRKELAAGVYSHVEVSCHNEGGWLFGLENNNYNAQELRDAARVFIEIADFLSEQGND